MESSRSDDYVRMCSPGVSVSLFFFFCVCIFLESVVLNFGVFVFREYSSGNYRGTPYLIH